ncbi:hypothetical protein CKY47_36230 [Saccharothrix yanglingensis]|uniref:Uncharacterized protein n=1 Tax=Saccharothrix yanglingensis TaxID=659496 RepID=A0ABU0XB00_9PSEU|nr:hypothetical protein [Saccharothrix yanglingensis]
MVATKNMLLTQGYTTAQADYLKFHVEVKAAELLSHMPEVDHATIAINYTPCGVEMNTDYRTTCDKMLTPILTRLGKSLRLFQPHPAAR